MGCDSVLSCGGSTNLLAMGWGSDPGLILQLQDKSQWGYLPFPGLLLILLPVECPHHLTATAIPAPSSQHSVGGSPPLNTSCRVSKGRRVLLCSGSECVLSMRFWMVTVSTRLGGPLVCTRLGEPSGLFLLLLLNAATASEEGPWLGNKAQTLHVHDSKDLSLTLPLKVSWIAEL